MPELSTRPAQTTRVLRRRTLLAGVVIHGPARLTIDCAIRDMSEAGARIRLPATAHLGPPIVLVTPRLGSLKS